MILSSITVLLGVPFALAVSLLDQRLQNADSQIQDICRASGVAGASIAVLHHGQVVHTYNYGVSNEEQGIPAGVDTVYGIGSLTKSFVAAGISHLVDRGDISWNTPVREVLPDFRHHDPVVERLLSISDLLSHRSGLDGVGDMSLAFQGDGDMLLPKDILYSLINNFTIAAPIRTEWGYFVWGYSLAGEIISKVSGVSLPEFLNQTIFAPLDMSATFDPAGADPKLLSEPYAGLEDGTAFHLPKRQVFKDTFFEASGGIYASVSDLLKWSSALLASLKSAEGPLVPGAITLLSNQVPIMNPSLKERSYGFGWIRTQLPGIVGLIGDNAGLWDDDEYPIMGTDDKPMLMVYHQGATVGYYSQLALFPETDSAVVVLTNSLALSDAADWIARATTQALFDFKDGHDYAALARETNKKAVAAFDQLAADVARAKEACDYSEWSGPPESKHLIGRYRNEHKPFFIDILSKGSSDDTLLLKFQGLEDQTYELRHLCVSTFEWTLTHDESKKRGRYSFTDMGSYLFEFFMDAERGGYWLSWTTNPWSDPPHTELFLLEGTASDAEVTFDAKSRHVSLEEL